MLLEIYAYLRISGKIKYTNNYQKLEDKRIESNARNFEVAMNDILSDSLSTMFKGLLLPFNFAQNNSVVDLLNKF